MELHSLIQEVKNTVSGYIDQRAEILNPDWITTHIMSGHDDVKGSDADFALIGCRAFIRNEVRKQLNSIKQDDSDPQQELTLDGMMYVQKYYQTKRDGETCSVRVDCLTFEELSAKIEEKRRMGQGNLSHADELERYRDDRFGSQKVTA